MFCYFSILLLLSLLSMYCYFNTLWFYRREFFTALWKYEFISYAKNDYNKVLYTTWFLTEISKKEKSINLNLLHYSPMPYYNNISTIFFSVWFISKLWLLLIPYPSAIFIKRWINLSDKLNSSLIKLIYHRWIKLIILNELNHQNRPTVLTLSSMD